MKRRLPRYRDLKDLLSFKKFDPDGTRRRLSAAHTVADIRTIAKRRTPAGPFDYVDGSAEEEITIRKVRNYFHDLEFQPAILRDVSENDTGTDLFGKRMCLPFGFAPTGFTRLLHTSGEGAVARVAQARGIPYALSTMSTTSIADLATAAPEARRWFQLYLWKDRDLSRQFIESAKQSGYEVLVVTVDVPVGGNRLRDLRNGMSIPPQLTIKSLLDASYRPSWWFNLLTTEPLRFAFAPGSEGGVAADFANKLYDPSATIKDLAWMREAWDGPLVVKGIQTIEDARRVVDFGVDGIILSNHGGRQLDRAPIPLRLLPEVVAAVGHKVTVMIDTGITSGADIVAALALGAEFAWIGRAYLYGLMAGGEAGVHRVVEILETEIVRTMKLLGVQRIEELNPDHVRLAEEIQARAFQHCLMRTDDTRQFTGV